MGEEERFQQFWSDSLQANTSPRIRALIENEAWMREQYRLILDSKTAKFITLEELKRRMGDWEE